MKNLYIFIAVVAFITAIAYLINKEWSNGAIWTGMGLLFIITYTNTKNKEK